MLYILVFGLFLFFEGFFIGGGVSFFLGGGEGLPQLLLCVIPALALQCSLRHVLKLLESRSVDSEHPLETEEGFVSS